MARLRLLITVIGLTVLTHPTAGAQKCGRPGVPSNARVSIIGPVGNDEDPDVTYDPGTSASYTCDLGYQLVGNPMVTCSSKGLWQGDLPVCGVNVALRKAANQSSTARGGSALNAIDGDRSIHHDVGGTGGRCSETNREASPWWMVNLLKPYPVNAVQITTRGCCDFQLHDIEIRAGNSTVPQKNPLCAWYPDTVGDAETKVFTCARPIVGQFVFVQMVGVEGSLSLCEVEVFSAAGDIPRESCTDAAGIDKVVAFNRTCYELQLNQGSTYAKARAFCNKQNGDLWHKVPDGAMELLTRELDRKRTSMKSQMVWIGAQKEPAFTSRTWRWVNGEVVDRPPWGREQPNNYNGEQNCVVLDGARDWLWNDVGCNLDYFHWVCSYPALTCGSPDRRVNNTVIGTNFTHGSTIKYSCPVGNVVVGAQKRTCLNTGQWSEAPPTCKYVDCGPLNSVKNGQVKLVDNRTTFNASAQYSCAENYTLVGNTSRRCAANGAWEPEEPQCLYGRCEPLPPFFRGSATVTGLLAGDTATYACDLGHKLQGNKVIRCELGGKWSSAPPECVFVDCGVLPSIAHGHTLLINGSTTFGSNVAYVCDDDYELEGDEIRVCQEDGRWSGAQPTCMLIECGEPEVPAGGFVTGFDFTIHSEIEYHCEKGHFLVGNPRRVCTAAGTWSGEPPTCNYVDCGPLPAISSGEVRYVNDTTYLDSQVLYVCNTNYRLEGNPSRSCVVNGKWTGTQPQCREIRCSIPDRPDGSILSISTSDRMRATTLIRGTDRDVSSSSFRIGSSVIYKCERGFRLDGQNSRTCDENGQWTGEPPTCTYVDCGSPEEIANGRLHLPNNATYMGSYAQYSCEPAYRLIGYERRLCLENGSWSGHQPECKEITCSFPAADADSGVSVNVSSQLVGGVATYWCQVGRRIVGNSARKCLTTGLWEDNPPVCELVDCGQPEEVENGRVFLVNATTTYGSITEYHCIPGFYRKGQFSRKCEADGKWNGSVPLCTDDKSLLTNEIDELVAERSGGGVGVWVGVGTGAGLVFLVLVGILYFKMKHGSGGLGKAAFSSHKSKRRSETMAPPNIPLPPTPSTPFTTSSPVGHPFSVNSNSMSYPANDIYEQFPEDAENHHMYDLTYEDAGGKRNSPINGIGSSGRPRSPPPLPPTGVTVNGVLVNGFSQP